MTLESTVPGIQEEFNQWGRVTQNHCMEQVRLEARPGKTRKDHTWPTKVKTNQTDKNQGRVHTEKKGEELSTFRLRKGKFKKAG